MVGEYLQTLDTAKIKAHAMAEQLARLEDQNQVLKARISEASNLRTEMVDSLTNCGAYLSSDGKKTPRKLLLKIQGHILKALDQDSQASPPPPDHGLVSRAGGKLRADPV